MDHSALPCVEEFASEERPFATLFSAPEGKDTLLPYASFISAEYIPVVGTDSKAFEKIVIKYGQYDVSVEGFRLRDIMRLLQFHKVKTIRSDGGRTAPFQTYQHNSKAIDGPSQAPYVAQFEVKDTAIAKEHGTVGESS